MTPKLTRNRVEIAPEPTVDDLNRMMESVQRGWVTYSGEGRFRSAQITARMDPEQVREVFRMLVAEVESREEASRDPILITLFSHPSGDAHVTGEPGPEEAPS